MELLFLFCWPFWEQSITLYFKDYEKVVSLKFYESVHPVYSLQTHCQANLYGMGRDPALFPDPEVYQPERWLRSRSEDSEDMSMKALTNLPWGHGARMCIGRRIAEQEIYIILSKVK